MLIHWALRTLFIDYVKTFKIKTGVEHYKLSFETINVKIGSFLGFQGQKTAQKLRFMKLWSFYEQFFTPGELKKDHTSRFIVSKESL